MRKTITRIAGAFMLLTTGSSATYAQMTGAYSIPGNFASLAVAINSLNTVGIGTGGATINIAAAYTETAPMGGYTLTATGTAGNPLVFQRSGAGANPLITAYTGTATPATVNQDGVFRLLGCDYVTFNGIDITDSNTANPATMEFGYGLFAAGITDGSQYNTIKNCVITLNRVNNAAGSGPSAAGSRGINVVGAINTAQTTVLTTIASTTGANSYNRFYNNLIQNCNIGISLYGGSTQANYDTNNDIGGTSAVTSNTIINYGGGATTSAAYGVYTMYQQNINVSNNIVNNNTGSGVNHLTTLYGIYVGNATGANSSIVTNTLTLSNGAAAGACNVIYNTSGSAVANTTVEISNNLIANCNNTIVTSGAFNGITNTGSAANVNINNNTFANNIVAGAATGAFNGIYNTGAPANLMVNNNTFTALTTQATSGVVSHIFQNGAPTGSISIQNNIITWTHNGSVSHSGIFYGINNASSGATSTLNVSGNDFSSITRTVTSAGIIFFINLVGNQSTRIVNGNTWTNLSLNNSNAQYLIYNTGTVTNSLTVNSNSIIGTYSRGTGTSNYLYGIYNNAVATATSGVREAAYNNFSNISATNPGAAFFYGIFDNGGGSVSAPYGKVLTHHNLISNVSLPTSGPTTSQFYGINSTGNIGSDGTNGSAVYSNTVTNISFQGAVYGYFMQPTNSDPARSTALYSNEISNVTGAYNVYGLYLNPGVNSNTAHLKVYKNKIANLTGTTTTAPVYGIYGAGSSYADIYNNLIGQLYSNYNSGTAPAVSGIYINSGFGNLWHNTIYLDAGSAASSSTLTVTAANFASAAAYVSATNTVDMRNNILINKSVPKGTGKTAALWRSAFALNTYSITSNNNLFYAGAPSASNVIYYDGATSFQGLSVYKSVVSPRDSGSVYESATPFLSTVPGATNYLHIDASQFTLVKSHAVNIPGITDDYDADIRQGSAGYTGSASSPDIGADEFNLCIPPLPPVSTSSLNNHVICGSAGGVTFLSASGNGTIDWYNVPFGGSPVATGNSFTTPVLTANTVFYASVTGSCSSNRIPFNVAVLPKPTASIMTLTNTICKGASISLIAVSDAATYTWSQGGGNATTIVISPSVTTVYNVAVSAAYGCTNTASQQIVVNPLPVLTATLESNPAICKGEVAKLKASGAQSYTWTANSLLATNYTVAATPIITTIYTVTGADENGCKSSATIEQKVVACTGINEAASGGLQLALYPNPTSGMFTVELNNGLDKTLELSDLTGRVIMKSTSGDAAITVDLSQFSNGVYYLKVRSDNAVEVVKVVKQ